MRGFQLHWDKDYGASKRTGWSVFVDGRCLAELERWLLAALWKVWRSQRAIDRSGENC